MELPARSRAFHLKGDPRIDFSFLLGEVTRLLRRAFDREMEAIGLTRSQWHVLVYVIKLEGPTQTKLAEALDIARPSVGALIDHLASSGYVSRERDSRDRRVWRIVPTRLAIQQADEFARSAERVASQAFDSVLSQDLAAAATLLSTIKDNLKSSSAGL
ncbi:MAG TPA: MarR family transcriptional regulator [Hyphomonas sp.]|nr:MarR family transcriptional regulator [Hyphomonas sp.]HRJ00259.1 MarR family transcriptional regulator [Hyphomonas sp.]HRK67154.1 MarR family transcriptional regulator [Hyphomonas sp.]